MSTFKFSKLEIRDVRIALEHAWDSILVLL